MTDLVFAARRIVTPTGERAGFVGVSAGRITEISDQPLPATTRITLADNEILLPGLVDTHVHVNDPGRTEWEGFATATRAAAAGGVTTLIDMPLNSIPPTTDLPALATKRATARDQIHVDVGFWAGAVPENMADLAGLHHDGVFGFKAFTLHSGVDEFRHLTRPQLAEAMHRIADLDALLIVHAENPATITEPRGRRYQNFLASRPPNAETSAIAGLLELAEHTGARLHILHLSSAEALPLLADAKQRGVRVTAETCPHYLTLTAEEIPDGATQFKCCPPIREAANRERLWQGLAGGTIDLIVTDHSPCTIALKRLDTGDFGQAWGGIAGLQLGLSAIWTAASERGFPITDVVRWMAQRPADLVGLPTKGRIEIGAYADLSVFAPDEEFTVTAANLHHRNKLTAYEGVPLKGVVRATWLRGRQLADQPTGTLLTRGDT